MAKPRRCRRKLVNSLGAPSELDRAGRIVVNQACSVPIHHNVFAIGDAASFMDANGKPLPGFAPVAMQQGYYVAELIDGDVRGKPIDRSFKYFDKGNMATIGRSRAVVEAGRIRFSGKLAWLAWLFIHVMYLSPGLRIVC